MRRDDYEDPSLPAPGDHRWQLADAQGRSVCTNCGAWFQPVDAKDISGENAVVRVLRVPPKKDRKAG